MKKFRLQRQRLSCLLSSIIVIFALHPDFIYSSSFYTDNKLAPGIQLSCCYSDHSFHIIETKPHHIYSLSSSRTPDSYNRISINENPFKYNGYYHDSESGLYYLNARYYSPTLMRFINRDTYDLLNRYAYCDSDPVCNSDPNGHISISNETYNQGILSLAFFGAAILTGNVTAAVASGLQLVGAGISLRGDACNDDHLRLTGKIISTTGIVADIAGGIGEGIYASGRLGRIVPGTRKIGLFREARECGSLTKVWRLDTRVPEIISREGFTPEPGFVWTDHIAPGKTISTTIYSSPDDLMNRVVPKIPDAQRGLEMHIYEIDVKGLRYRDLSKWSRTELWKRNAPIDAKETGEVQILEDIKPHRIKHIGILCKMGGNGAYFKTPLSTIYES